MTIRDGAAKGVKILSTWFERDAQGRNELLVTGSGPNDDAIGLTVWGNEGSATATVHRADLLEALGVTANDNDDLIARLEAESERFGIKAEQYRSNASQDPHGHNADWQQARADLMAEAVRALKAVAQ